MTFPRPVMNVHAANMIVSGSDMTVRGSDTNMCIVVHVIAEDMVVLGLDRIARRPDMNVRGPIKIFVLPDMNVLAADMIECGPKTNLLTRHDCPQTRHNFRTTGQDCPWAKVIVSANINVHGTDMNVL